MRDIYKSIYSIKLYRLMTTFPFSGSDASKEYLLVIDSTTDSPTVVRYRPAPVPLHWCPALQDTSKYCADSAPRKLTSHIMHSANFVTLATNCFCVFLIYVGIQYFKEL